MKEQNNNIVYVLFWMFKYMQKYLESIILQTKYNIICCV